MKKKVGKPGPVGKQPRRSKLSGAHTPRVPQVRPTKQASAKQAPAGRALPGLAAAPRAYAPRVAEAAIAPYAARREQEIPAGEFKARCLELMDRVRDRHESIVITKHGRPVARLVPYEEQQRGIVGFMRGTVLWSGDLITPVDEAWDADAD